MRNITIFPAEEKKDKRHTPEIRLNIVTIVKMDNGRKSHVPAHNTLLVDLMNTRDHSA